MKLRDYQQYAIDKMRSEIKSGVKKMVLQIATGGGKTAVASAVTEMAYEKNKRVWFIADTTELVEQTVETFERFGLDCGVIQGIHEKTNYEKPLQVATAQTLLRRLDKQFADAEHWMPDLVIIDECHVVYKSHKMLMERLPNVIFIGLSATPFSKGLGLIYDSLIIGATTKKLQQDGFLVPIHAYAARKKVDLKGVKTKANGDWNESGLEEKVNNKEIVADIVSNWLRLGENRQTIVFCVNVAHSKHVCEQFLLRGVKAMHLDGRTEKEQRKEIINDYKSGEIKVLTSVGVLTKGFDAPSTSCVVLARPTKSLMLHIQMIGRGLRIADNKDDCIILDHAGNLQRNGFPDDELPKELCDGTAKGQQKDRKQKDAPLPKECTKCGYIKPPGSVMCFRCGHIPERQNDVETVDGEMVSLKKANKEATKDQKQAFYSGLISYGSLNGYKEGWAANQYKEKFGVWPNAYDKKPGDITPEINGWIKHQRIKHAKSRGAA